MLGKVGSSEKAKARAVRGEQIMKGFACHAKEFQGYHEEGQRHFKVGG